MTTASVSVPLAPKDRIIVPLDVNDETLARSLVESLANHVGAFKIGYELGFGIGWEKAARLVTDAGGKLFVDAKLDDIPNTVGKGAAAIAAFRPTFLTVHASAGVVAMRAAKEASGDHTRVLAVTVLTSLSDDDTNVIFGAPAHTRVVDFALLAAEAGVDGVVCSPQELEVLKKAIESSPQLKKLAYVTPGVRPTWAAANDQKRVMTPGNAIAAGADYLVIGRPITNPPAHIGSPVDAAMHIAEELRP